MKIGVLIEARSTSSRLPGKCFEEVGHGLSLIQMVYQRCWTAVVSKKPYVITPHQDTVLMDYCKEHKLNCLDAPGWCRPGDLMQELYYAMTALQLDAAIEVTGDCPFVQPKHIEEVAKGLESGKEFYAVLGPSGFEVRGVTKEALSQALDLMDDYRRNGTTIFYRLAEWDSEIRWEGPTKSRKYSIDTREDLEFVRRIYEEVAWKAEIADVLACGEAIGSMSSPTSDPTTPESSPSPST